jgi:hypothetical protein
LVVEDHDELVPSEEVGVPTVRTVEVRAKGLDLMIQILGRDAHEQECPLGTSPRGDHRWSPDGIAQALPHDDAQVVLHRTSSSRSLHHRMVSDVTTQLLFEDLSSP